MGWLGIWGEFAGTLIATITIFTFIRRFFLGAGRFLKPGTLYRVFRSSSVRFSASTLLSVQADGGFVLVLTPERTGPPNYGPIGGVIKYKASMGAGKFLKWHIRDDKQIHTENDDMDRDLRVFMPPRSFLPFVRWYRSQTSRETAHETLKREIAEELPNLSGGKVADVSLHLSFSNLHKSVKVFRDRHGVAGLLHVREFNVVTVEPDEWGQKFKDELIRMAREGQQGLKIVTPQEIEVGRCGQIRVGAHCFALLGTNMKNSREDEPVRKLA